LAARRRNETCDIAIKSDPKEPSLGSEIVDDIFRLFRFDDDGVDVVEPFSSLQ
jgi:hypothetical protein